MKYFFLLASVFFLTFSCQKKNEDKEVCDSDSSDSAQAKQKSGTEKKFEMYKMSEMAALMEQMYVENKMVKERIVKGEPIGKFPDYFLKIHTAKFTDESDNDAFFKENATLYITAQKLIYDDPANAKQHFNEGVKACLTCHETKCGGPIPKIKKLYID